MRSYNIRFTDFSFATTTRGFLSLSALFPSGMISFVSLGQASTSLFVLDSPWIELYHILSCKYSFFGVHGMGFGRGGGGGRGRITHLPAHWIWGLGSGF